MQPKEVTLIYINKETLRLQALIGMQQVTT